MSNDAISDLVKARSDEIVETGRFFHGIPELGFEEKITAKAIS